MATVVGGAPRVRTVVFREFYREHHLTFIGDRRHDKTEHIAANDRAEVHWLFDQMNQQFRLRGRLRAITDAAESAEDQALRRHLWANTSPSTRAQQFWPQPGAPMTDEPAPIPDEAALQAIEAPPAPYMAMELIVEEADWLRLTKPVHHRALETRQADGTWHWRRINP